MIGVFILLGIMFPLQSLATMTTYTEYSWLHTVKTEWSFNYTVSGQDNVQPPSGFSLEKMKPIGVTYNDCVHNVPLEWNATISVNITKGHTWTVGVGCSQLFNTALGVDLGYTDTTDWSYGEAFSQTYHLSSQCGWKDYWRIDQIASSRIFTGVVEGDNYVINLADLSWYWVGHIGPTNAIVTEYIRIWAAPYVHSRESIECIPAPSALLLLVSGLAGVVGLRRKRLLK